MKGNMIRTRHTLFLSDAAAEHLHKEMGRMPLQDMRYLRITPTEDGHDFTYSRIHIGDLVCTERGISLLVQKEFEAGITGMTLDYDGKIYLTRNHHP